MSERIAKRLTISGKVQGVWYRAWFEREANTLGLYGFVRNRLDGSVEALIAGTPDAVAAMTKRAHEGSPASSVSDVTVEDAKGFVPNRFEVKPTV